MTCLKHKYERAEQMLTWNIETKLNNLTLVPHWLDDDVFWYKHEVYDAENVKGHEYVLVDTNNLFKQKVFDHMRLADVLSVYLKREFDPHLLPIESLFFQGKNELVIVINEAVGFNIRLIIDVQNNNYRVKDSMSLMRGFAEKLPTSDSPNGRYSVILRAANLYLYDHLTENEKELTSDGEANYGYGTRPDYMSISPEGGEPLGPAVLWSPDGINLAVQRIDQRKVKDLPLVQSVPGNDIFRPINHTYKMGMPGDKHIELASLCVINLPSGAIVHTGRSPVVASNGGIYECMGMRWGVDGCLYFIEWARDRSLYRLIQFDPKTVNSCVLFEERGKGILYPGALPVFGPAIFEVVAERNEFIWYSQRSGWGHLYRYDLITGQLKNAITTGEYVVTGICKVDVEEGLLYFTACGREPQIDPYYEHLYRIGLDGSGIILLTPEVSQHDIIKPVANIPDVQGVSPNGNVFVDTYSRVDQPTRTILRSTLDGSELMLLSEFNTTPLKESPYMHPKIFCAKSTDGVTDLWGFLQCPSDFDSSKRYPVILVIYGTPASRFTPKRFGEFKDNRFFPLAELGFVVVVLDPRGTPLRSKAFHDVAYGNLQNGGGIDDQVAVLKQLAQSHPWMDLEHVGITGHSGGGFAAARAMLSHPDFFKVGVSSSGNHDQRTYVAGWGESFQGLLKNSNYCEQSSVALAKNLRGKLLLIHGDMDENVHVANTLQLVHELINFNKDFDLLILPNRRHHYFEDPYFIRRSWDYFVKYLALQKPPTNYMICRSRNTEDHS